MSTSCYSFSCIPYRYLLHRDRYFHLSLALQEESWGNLQINDASHDWMHCLVATPHLAAPNLLHPPRTVNNHATWSQHSPAVRYTRVPQVHVLPLTLQNVTKIRTSIAVLSFQKCRIVCGLINPPSYTYTIRTANRQILMKHLYPRELVISTVVVVHNTLSSKTIMVMQTKLIHSIATSTAATIPQWWHTVHTSRLVMGLIQAIPHRLYERTGIMGQ